MHIEAQPAKLLDKVFANTAILRQPDRMRQACDLLQMIKGQRAIEAIANIVSGWKEPQDSKRDRKDYDHSTTCSADDDTVTG